MGFDAAKAVKPLDWDFSAFDGGSGTVPEPTGKQIAKFYTGLDAVSRDALKRQDIDADADVPPDKLLEAADAAVDDEADIVALHEKLTGVYADLCHGSPTKAQISKLPFRVRMAFFNWIAGELRPEASGAATTQPQLSIVRGA